MKLYSHTVILNSQHIEGITLLFPSIYLLMSNLIVFPL